jgi:hypothetical protein
MPSRSTTLDLHVIESIKYCAENEPRLFDSMLQTLHAAGMFERFDDSPYFADWDMPGSENPIPVEVRWESA